MEHLLQLHGWHSYKEHELELVHHLVHVNVHI